MTFFANAGVTWPHLDSLLRDAGRSALEGGTRLWHLFAILEGEDTRVRREDGVGIKEECVRHLRQAAVLFERSIDDMPDQPFDGLRPSEVDLAALPYYSRYYGPSEEWFRMWPGGASVRFIYMELIKRLQILAADVSVLNIEGDSRDLAPQVFRLMKSWEIISLFARVLAVANQRPPARM